MTTKKTKEDWISEGIKRLKSQGPSAISAEKLSKHLGVTRGSFYHHFSNISQFNDAILDYWVETNTTTPFQEAKEKSSNVGEELQELVEKSWHVDTDLEVAVRNWAATNKQARERLIMLDQFRLDYLIEIYQNVVGDKEKGKSFAQIAFYGLLGAIHAQPKIPEEELGKLINEIQNVMLKDL